MPGRLPCQCRLVLQAICLLILVSPETTGPIQAAVSSNSEYLIDVWQSDDGLPQNSVIAISQTPDGYLWFGTFKGLVRFDGFRFKVFDARNTPALGGGVIGRLYTDRMGRLWTATVNGELAYYEKGRFVRVNLPGGTTVLTSTQSIFAEDEQGTLLVSTGRGVLQWKGTGFIPFEPARSFAHLATEPRIAYALGRFWLASARGLARQEGDRFAVVLEFTNQ